MSEKRYQYRNGYEDTRMEDSMEEKWMNVAKDDKDKSNIHALRWNLYTREKEELINIGFLVSVSHPKVGETIWNCVKDNTIKGKEQCNYIGLRGFDYK